jgi:hypothetical protein
MGGWVGPSAVLDAVVKRKIPSPRRIIWQIQEMRILERIRNCKV